MGFLGSKFGGRNLDNTAKFHGEYSALCQAGDCRKGVRE
jgi:hypothetical protein